MSRIRIRAKVLTAAVLVAVTAFGFVAPVAGSANAGRAILKSAILK